MKGTITTLYPNNLASCISVEAPPTLAMLQAKVDGYIELIPGFTSYANEPCIAYCNEEGKISSLAVNARATKLWAEQGQHDDILVGTIVILQGDDEFMESL